MTQPGPWYETFFGKDYLDVYAYQFTDNRARQEVEFVTRTLELQPGEGVLDLCCGQGRHAVCLAAQGLQVVALDLSAEYLELARAAASALDLSIETVHADMRDIPFEDRFDAVINMFSSFGYLESEDEDARVLHAITRALKPGGRVLLDLLNRDWVVANYIQNDWHEAEDGTLYLEHRELDLETSRNHVSFRAIRPDGSRQDIVGHHIRLYTLREVRGMLEAAGLAYKGVHGGFSGEAYSIETRRMIVVASKPV
jgi:SAM-dependent methyltransferase